MIPKKRVLAIVIGMLSIILFSACGSSQQDSRVFFIEPQDGENITSPFTVKMGSANLVIEPAREDDAYAIGHGHHHIVVDAELPNLELPIPKNSLKHLHFGKGQIETTLDLEPGERSLKLLFAKGDHVSWSPAQTASINVTVVE